MTVSESINRGYNLMVTVVLALAGLSFGSDAIAEADFVDKLDDLGLLVIGAIALIWYHVGRNKFQRTPLPIILAAIALAVQIIGLPIENDDADALGDNIGGMFLFVPFFIYTICQYVINGRGEASASGAGAAQNPPA